MRLLRSVENRIILKTLNHTKLTREGIYTFAKILLLGIGFILSHSLSAQIQVTPATDDPFTPDNLIENVFLGDGVEITNLEFIGVPQAVGLFSNGDGDIDLSRGIVMSTGEVSQIPNSSDVLNGGDTSGGLGDTDLGELVDEELLDLAKYEITFIPISDQLSFRYVFASEEYEEFVCDRFNDIFGFFISGPDPAGGVYDVKNIALVPDPADPTGQRFTDFPVSTNSINHGSIGCDPDFNTCGDCTKANESLLFSQYYIDNSASSTLVFDGLSTVLTARIDVIPCQEYTIKLAISDVADNGFSSAVFLEAKSFSSPTLKVDRADDATVDGSISEGCTDAIFRFQLPSVASRDTFIEIEYITDADFPIAERGVDYTLDQATQRLFIDEGQDQVELKIRALLDTELEQEESILIGYQKNICERDTLRIIIRDKIIETINLVSPDLPFCTEGYTVDAVDPGGDASTLTPFVSRQLIRIENANESYTDSILVDGVEPAILSQGLIAKICIDSLEHIVPEDLDIYLRSPGGQILELSTDNGGFGEPNVTVFDKFINTCFVINGAPNINNGDPLAGQPFAGNPTYTGDFLPEGDWSDLLNGENPVNGFWKLTVIDDSGDGSGGNSTTGALRGWSLEFNAPYEVSYEWALPDGTVNNTISDPNILNTTFTPTSRQTYVLTATDSYGCDFSDEITVEPGDLVVAPENLRCVDATSNSLLINWDIVGTPLGFDFFIGLDSMDIDPSQWVALPLQGQKDTTGLEPNTEYVIGVRSVGDGCVGDPIFIVCFTSSCTPPDISNFIKTDASACRNDGSILITPTGQAPFTFELAGNIQDNGDYAGLPAGSYEIIIKDVTGCPDTLSTIIEKDSLSVVVSELIPIGCFGGNGAVIAIPNPSPVSQTYEVAWNNATPQSSDDVSVLTLGNIPSDEYTIEITDESGCTATDTFMLEQPTEVKATAAPIITPLSCSDANDGTISVPIEGGTAPYSYEWRDDQFQVVSRDSLATGLSPGGYTLFVTDSRNCSMMATVQGNVPINNGFIIDQGTISPPKCAGGSDGQGILLNRTGEEPLTYNWLDEDGNTVGTEATVSTLRSGTYSVEIRDRNNCLEIVEVNIPEVAPVIIDAIDIVDSRCFNTNEGSITIEVSGGQNIFKPYEWTKLSSGESLDGIDNGGNSETLGQLQRGNYAVTIKDQNDCPIDTMLVVDSPPDFSIAAVIDTVDCFGDATGSVDISVSGAIAPYSYEWFGGSVFTQDEDPSNLPRNDYAVRVTDNVGCFQDSTFFVPENEKIVPTLRTTDVACKNEATGKIELFLAGGKPGFRFDWQQNGQPLGIDSSTISTLEPGRFTVTVTDQLGCVADTNYVVTEPETEFIVSVIPDTICRDAFEPGRLEVVAEGGIPFYTYLWSDGSNESFNNLPAGDYTVAASDQAGCIRELDVTLEEVTTFEITQIDASTAKCADQASGTATINIEDINYEFGTENLVIEDIIWSGLPEEKELTTNRLTGGEWHFVELIDQFGCSALDSVFIDNPPALGLDLVSKVDITCFAEENGMLNIEPVNGEGPFGYTWSQSTNFQTTQNATGLGPGIHEVLITDVNGCEVRDAFEIFEPPLLEVEGRTVRSRCFGDNTGRVDLLVIGGTPEYEYNWSDQSTSKNILDVPLGDYTVTVTDFNQCTAVEEVTVEGPTEALDFTMEVIPPDCPELNTGIIEVTATGGNGFYSYSNDGVNFVRNQTLVGLVEGSYTVTVKDINGCSISKDTMITNPEGLTLFIGRDTTLATGQTVFVGTDIRRGGVPVDGNEPFDFDWSIFPDDVGITGFEEFINIENLQESIIVTLNLTDSLGCMVTASRRIDVESMRENLIEVPTGFTPNGDGANDVLKVLGRNGVTVNSFRVFSRWGELVHNAEEYQIDIDDETLGWDGRFNGKVMNPGTFVWVVEATFEDGFQSIYRGNTQLIR